MTISMTMPQYRRRECTYRGQTVKLTPTETEIVSTLLVLRGRCISREDLLVILWPNPDEEPDWASNMISVYLCRLKEKLPGLIMVRFAMGLMIP